MTTIETIYRFTHDRAAVNSLLRDQAKIDAALEDTSRAAKKTAEAYTDMERTGSKAAAAQKTAAETASKSASSGGGAVGGGQFAALGGLAGGLGQSGLNQQLMLAADLLDAAEAAKAMSGALPSLTSGLSAGTLAMGAGAVAVGALVVGLKLLSDAAADSRKEVQDQIAAEELRSKTLNDIRNMSSEQIQTEIATIQEEIATRSQLVERLLEDGNALRDSFNLLEDFGETYGVANQGLDDYQKKIDELNDQNALAIQRFQLLVEALGGVTIATNDAQIAADNFSQALADRAQKDFERYSEVLRAADTYSQDQLDQRIADLQREQRAMQASGYSTSEAGKARMAEIDVLLSWLEQTRPAIQAREDEAAAAERSTEITKELAAARDEETENAAELRAERAQTNKTILDIEVQYAADSAKIAEDRARAALEEEADFLRQRNRDWADFYAGQAEQDAEYYADRNDILADLQEGLAETEESRKEELYKLNQDLEKSARDHGKRMRDIEQSAKSEIRRGALRLDAIAIYEAEQRRKEEIDAEEDQYQEQKRDREQQYRDALRLLDKETSERRRAAAQALADLEKQHAAQRAKDEANFQQRLAREDQDRAIRLQRQNEAYNREDAARLASYNVQIMNLQNHLSNVENELKAHYARMQVLHALGQQGMTPESVLSDIGKKLFHSGGYTPSGDIRTREGEFVSDPTTTRIMERGVGQKLTQQNIRRVFNQTNVAGTTIQMPASNMTPGEMMRLWDRWFDSRMARMAGKS